MPATFEYKVIPAPAKGRKAPGVKGAEARFAHTLEAALNEMAAEGWEYLRSDILPSEERQGLTSSHTVYRSVLVFQRAVQEGERLDTEPAQAEEAVPNGEAETDEQDGIAPETASEDDAAQGDMDTSGETDAEARPERP